MGGKGEIARRGLCRIDLVGDGRAVSVMFEAALTRERALGLLDALRKAGDRKAAEAAHAFLKRSGTGFSGFCMREEFTDAQTSMDRAGVFLHGSREDADALAGDAAKYFLCADCLLKKPGESESGCFLAARRSPDGAGFRWDVAGQNFTSGSGFLDAAFPVFRFAGAGEGFRNLDGPLPSFPCFGCVDMLGVLMEMERHAPLSPQRALGAAIR